MWADVSEHCTKLSVLSPSTSDLTESSQSYLLQLWQPPDASTALKNNVRPKIVLISRGNVDWITKAKYAEAAGAIGIFMSESV